MYNTLFYCIKIGSEYTINHFMFGALLIALYKERRDMTTICPEMFRGKTVPLRMKIIIN